MQISRGYSRPDWLKNYFVFFHSRFLIIFIDSKSEFKEEV